MEVVLDQSELHKVGFRILELQQWGLLLFEPLLARDLVALSIELTHDQVFMAYVSINISVHIP